MDEYRQKERSENESINTNMENDDIVNTGIDDTPDVMQEKLEDEEFSTEFTANDAISSYEEDDETDESNNMIGWVAVALSILSLFMMPVLFGGAGIVVGFISRNRNAEWLGNTAIIVGVISILISLFFLPLR